jgi:hypothetical protein
MRIPQEKFAIARTRSPARVPNHDSLLYTDHSDPRLTAWAEEWDELSALVRI